MFFSFCLVFRDILHSCRDFTFSKKYFTTHKKKLIEYFVQVPKKITKLNKTFNVFKFIQYEETN